MQQALAYLTRQGEASQGVSDVKDPVSDDDAHMNVTEDELASPAGGSPRDPRGGVSSAAPMDVDETELAPDEVEEALAAMRQAGLGQLDTDSETEGPTPEPAPEADRAPHLQAVDAVSVSSTEEFQDCLPATEAEALKLGYATAFCPGPADCPVGRGHQDNAEIDDDLDPGTLSALDEFAARLAVIPDMTQAKEVLTLDQLGLFAQLPTSYPWGDVMFSTLHVTEAGLHTVRNTLALRRMVSDAPALTADEKLRFLRSWLTCLATSLATVFAPLVNPTWMGGRVNQSGPHGGLPYPPN